jgi:hypothetical protein
MVKATSRKCLEKKVFWISKRQKLSTKKTSPNKIKNKEPTVPNSEKKESQEQSTEKQKKSLFLCIESLKPFLTKLIKRKFWTCLKKRVVVRLPTRHLQDIWELAPQEYT